MTLNDYLMSVYVDGGRGEIAQGFRRFDCWGFVRAIRHDLYGKPLMPSYGNVCPSDKRQVTDAWIDAQVTLEACEPTDGAIACVFYGRVLLHVGVVIQSDRGLAVAEITPEAGARVVPLPRYEIEYKNNNIEVKFYDDKSLSQQD
ncbi:C40 family peptidase [Halomonas daqingensis]|uniref:C40 family peptidase n=1 Tax=Billgrantia desiderata TaxID=52021 RepID=A0AAW4YZB4_9GAMM|nr:hypothetical protein [Halomonas desiderata]MCE8053519.1 C40 family peptidase [Halomonas desiderata]